MDSMMGFNDDADFVKSLQLSSKESLDVHCLAVEPEQQIHVRGMKTAKEATP